MEETKKELTLEDYKMLYAKAVKDGNALYQRIQEITSVFRRLDYMLAIIKLKDSFSKEFIDSCVKEVEELMTIAPEEKDNTEEK